MPRTLFQTAGVRIGGLSKELSVPTGRIGRVSTQAAERCAAEESDTSAVINLAWVCTRPGPGAVVNSNHPVSCRTLKKVKACRSPGKGNARRQGVAARTPRQIRRAIRSPEGWRYSQNSTAFRPAAPIERRMPAPRLSTFHRLSAPHLVSGPPVDPRYPLPKYRSRVGSRILYQPDGLMG